MRILLAVLFSFPFLIYAQKTEQWSRVKLNTRITLQHYNYTPWRDCISTERKDNFIDPLLKLVDEGVIQVFRPAAPYNLPFSKKEIALMLHTTDTVLRENFDNGLFDTIFVKRSVASREIYSLVFREEWELDALSNKFIKLVKGMILERMVIDHYDGRFMGTEALFYVSFGMSSVKDPGALNKSLLQLYHQTEIKLNSVEQHGNQSNVPEKIASLLAPFLNEKADMHSPKYPYTSGLSKDERGNILTNKKFISDYYLSEIWTFDLSNFSFKKTVTGIL